LGESDPKLKVSADVANTWSVTSIMCVCLHYVSARHRGSVVLWWSFCI